MLRFIKIGPEASTQSPKVELVIAIEDLDVMVSLVQVFLYSEQLELHSPS